MRKILFLLLFILTINVNAQESSNVVKWSPASLYFNSALFQWEQHVGKNGLILDIGIPINTSISGRFGITSNTVASSKVGLETVQVGYRFYISKQPIYGTYLEPYFKTQTLRGTIVCNNNLGTVNAYLYTNNFGLQLGKQWLFGKHFVLDFYPIGLELGRVNGSAISKSDTEDKAIIIENSFNTDVKSYLPKYVRSNYYVGRYQTEVSAQLHSSWYPSFRTGFMIGYKFK